MSTNKLKEYYTYHDSNSEQWEGFASPQGRLWYKYDYDDNGNLKTRIIYLNEAFYDKDGDGHKELGRIQSETDYTDSRGTVTWENLVYYKDAIGNDTDYFGKRSETVNGTQIALYEYFYDDSNPSNWVLSGARKYITSGADSDMVIEYKVLGPQDWKPIKMYGALDGNATLWWYYDSTVIIRCQYGSYIHPYYFSGNIVVKKSPQDGKHYIYSFDPSKPFDYSHWVYQGSLTSANIVSFTPSLPELPSFTGVMAGGSDPDYQEFLLRGENDPVSNKEDEQDSGTSSTYEAQNTEVDAIIEIRNEHAQLFPGIADQDGSEIKFVAEMVTGSPSRMRIQHMRLQRLIGLPRRSKTP